MNKSLVKMAVILLLCWGCRSSPGTADSDKTVSARGQGSKTHRFLKVYSTVVGDTVYTDSTLLQFKVNEADSVSGIYRWVLPEKDGKDGTLSGRLSSDTVYGRYHYQQEGGNYDDSIMIILQNQKAVVTQFSPGNYLLKDTLAQK